MTEVRTVHTADLRATERAAARALLWDVFSDDMTEQDWEHALGGVHALAVENGELIGHASVVQRRLLHGGRALRTGYVEGVAVRADRRRRGHGGAMMAALERVIAGGYMLGALGSSNEGAPFYTVRNWQLWRGPTSALTPRGIVRTPEDDGSVYVFRPPAAPESRQGETNPQLNLDGELTCDWREGDVW